VGRHGNIKPDAGDNPIRRPRVTHLPTMARVRRRLAQFLPDTSVLREFTALEKTLAWTCRSMTAFFRFHGDAAQRRVLRRPAQQSLAQVGPAPGAPTHRLRLSNGEQRQPKSPWRWPG